MATLSGLHLTFEEYIALELQTGSKFEYGRGYVFAMEKASPAHSVIQANLTASLVRRLAGTRCRTYSSNLRILVQASDFCTYPDLAIVCEPIDFAHGMTATNPKVLFEVLAPSTRRDDRIGKSLFYRQIPSLDEFILVEQESYCVDRLRPLPGGQWELTRFQGEDAILEIPSLNLTIPLKEIYANVPFELAERDPEQP
ncbi:MAG: Uma2 family endonuclease [Bryobacteraceae bacterium]